MSSTKNLIELKLLMNPTKNLIELKLYRNPTKNLIELKLYELQEICWNALDMIACMHSSLLWSSDPLYLGNHIS